MPRPRKLLVDPSRTVYYHVTSRCVRRAFLCGSDQQTGVSYEHRREWIEQRIRMLSSIFAIEICAYSVMHNHYHIVVKLSPEEPKDWSTQETLDRWLCLHQGPTLAQKAANGDSLTHPETELVENLVTLYKTRLSSLSWFMKALNEPIARMANREDNCTGHFWESRFSSQALFTTAALIACMAYVDLNPVRANISVAPENSAFTSIKERIDPRFNLRTALADELKAGTLRSFDVPVKPLMKFIDELRPDEVNAVPHLAITSRQYRDLINYTGTSVRFKGHPPRVHTPPRIVKELGLTANQWLIDANHFEALHRRGAFGSPLKMAMGLSASLKTVS